VSNAGQRGLDAAITPTNDVDRIELQVINQRGQVVRRFSYVSGLSLSEERPWSRLSIAITR
jgi:hypothetical protein